MNATTPPSPLRRRLLRALYALSEDGGRPSLEALFAIVPAPRAEILEAFRALDADGLVDAHRVRLTMMGLVAAKTPTPIAYERRGANRGKDVTSAA